uniref:Uncharacterized protein n=2 Tax=Physcomitrium patens TaxID=3218 RepID=A0A2K1IEM6_PHYPA|nr:hypothetical protein PHYPA_029881 [Physcomitrium patens]
MATTAQTLGGIEALSFSANCSSMQKLGDGLVRDKMCPPARKQFQVRAMAPKKKVNAHDDAWSKQWFGAGVFAENTETESVDIVKKLEKKLLSQVEKAGLLSKAESLGVSLSQIEKLGLLSKAEDLGLLTLAEKFVTTSPASLASVKFPSVSGIAPVRWLFVMFSFTKLTMPPSAAEISHVNSSPLSLSLYDIGFTSTISAQNRQFGQSAELVYGQLPFQRAYSGGAFEMHCPEEVGHRQE